MRQKNQERFAHIDPSSIRIFFLLAALVWTALVLGALLFQYQRLMESASEAAKIEARSLFVKDVIYRRWSASLGGLYGDTASGLEPNPYLEKIAERDVSTLSGKKLTLVNPAYMTRMVHELGFLTEGVRANITSLDPIRPANRPDPWEREALEGFINPEDEFVEIQLLDGQRYLRFMKPLLTEASCLPCHAFQGYELGDIRGGISVAVPLESYEQIKRADFASLLGGLSFIWALGLAGIAFGGISISERLKKQMAAEERVRQLLGEREMLFREVQHRIKNNMNTMATIMQLKSYDLQDEAARQVLEDMSGRFHTMMKLYQRLYTSHDAYQVSLKDFLPELAEEVLQSSGAEGRISLVTRIADVTADPNLASSLGIIVAEATGNSVKYAFPEGRQHDGGQSKGDNWIELSLEVSDGKGEFTYRDNGIGMDAARGQESEGLGLRMIGALAQQIGGEALFDYTRGFCFRIQFPL